MSTTTAGGTAGVEGIGDVAAYAQAVRRHLVGLTSEQVDDLTDDLEADLADTLADSSRGADGADIGSDAGVGGDLVARFGPPAAYAAELRSAAGLPDEPATGRRTTVRARMSRAVRTRVASAYEVLSAQVWWDPVSAFFVSLRPFGWVVRGWVAFQLLDAVRNVFVSSYGAGLDAWPGGLPAQLVLIAMIVVSVQWGRDRWLPGPWVRLARRWTTVIAAVALLPVLVATQPDPIYVDGVGYTDTVYVASELQDGVVVDGMAVSNLFVYDAEGNPLEDVQIYDDRGRPVRTTADDGSGQWSLPGVDEPWSFRPVQDEDGRTRWNVYPLYGAPSSSFTWNGEGRWDLTDGATTRVPPRPFAKAPAILAHEETGAADSGLPAEGSSVSPSASPSASADATAGPGAVDAPSAAPEGSAVATAGP